MVRPGNNVTIVAFSIGMTYALKAAEELAKKHIMAEVIDLRTIRPMDTETIIESVKKTGRLVTVEEGWPQSGVGAEIAARVMEHAFDYLDAPVIARHRQGRADAVCGQSRKARAAVGRRDRRCGQGRQLPVRTSHERALSTPCSIPSERAREGRHRGAARGRGRWRPARHVAARVQRSEGLGHSARRRGASGRARLCAGRPTKRKPTSIAAHPRRLSLPKSMRPPIPAMIGPTG